jgi:UDP-glucuronate decarboxylase
MIRWIDKKLGTGAYNNVKQGNYNIVDVRLVVDKDGNKTETLRATINTIVSSLKSNAKTVVCCDYGISRSNSLAAAAWSVYKGITFDEALSIVIEATGEKDIKIEMITAIRKVLEGNTERKNNNVLITGANGFLGKSLIPELKKHLHVVPYYSSYGDLTMSGKELEKIIVKEQIGQIVHLANPKVYTSAIALGYSLNMLKNVLDICKLHSVKLIYPSGWEVFSGYNTTTLTVTENTQLLPKGTYGESKMLAEQLINHFRDNHGLSYLLFRICPVYGLGSDKPRFIYTFISQALKNEDIVTHVYKNGNPHLELLHINDLVEFMSQAICNNLTGCYHIGGGSYLSTYEIAKMTVKRLNSQSTIKQIQIDDYVANINLDDSKLLSQCSLQHHKKRSFETELDVLIKTLH